MSCKPGKVKVIDGRSSWDVVLDFPTMTEVALVEILFDAELIEGETYMGPICPVMLFRWTEKTVETDDEEWMNAPLGPLGEETT